MSITAPALLKPAAIPSKAREIVSEVELNEPSGRDTPEGVSVTLPTFEGPLDLLLHLCQKHELDILDIPIAFVTEKYLEFLAVMQLINLDVASEYLVMAATLAHIKSKSLLPAPPPGQEDELTAEEEDPREALIRRLLEYQKYKLAGEQLQARGVAGRDVFLRGMPIEEATHTGLPPLAQVPLFSLVEAFQNVLSKSKIKLSHDVVHERITLTDRINELVDVLRERRRVAFEELFEEMHTRFDLVITFLALLEMTRLRMTRLFQADFDSNIYIEFTAQVSSEDDDYEAHVGEEAEPMATAPSDTERPQPADADHTPFVTDISELSGDLLADEAEPSLPRLTDDAVAPHGTIPSPAVEDELPDVAAEDELPPWPSSDDAPITLFDSANGTAHVDLAYETGPVDFAPQEEPIVAVPMDHDATTRAAESAEPSTPHEAPPLPETSAQVSHEAQRPRSAFIWLDDKTNTSSEDSSPTPPPSADSSSDEPRREEPEAQAPHAPTSDPDPSS